MREKGDRNRLVMDWMAPLFGSTNRYYRDKGGVEKEGGAAVVVDTNERDKPGIAIGCVV